MRSREGGQENSIVTGDPQSCKLFVPIFVARDTAPVEFKKGKTMAQVVFRGLIRWGTAAGVLLAFPLVSSAQSAKPTPTFTKDVAVIFQEKCESCHRPDSIAPMSLVTYEEARPWARSIKNRVASRQMPPWHIDKTIGIQHFQNDRSLSDEQIDTVVRWVDGGAPKGDPKDMPPPVKWADDSVWNFASIFGGPPDLIIKRSEEHTSELQSPCNL